MPRKRLFPTLSLFKNPSPIKIDLELKLNGSLSSPYTPTRLMDGTEILSTVVRDINTPTEGVVLIPWSSQGKPWPFLFWSFFPYALRLGQVLSKIKVILSAHPVKPWPFPLVLLFMPS